MNTIKTIVFILILILIKIGDTVLLTFSLPKKAGKNILKSLKKKRLHIPSFRVKNFFFLERIKLLSTVVKKSKRKVFFIKHHVLKTGDSFLLKRQ